MPSNRLRPPRTLYRTNKSQLAFDLFWDWSVVFVACWIGYTSDILVGKLLAILFIGTHLHRIAILGHDGAHFLFAKNRRLNDIVANLLCFYPLGGTVEGYRAWHFNHHRWVGTANDPEREIKQGHLYSIPFSRKRFSVVFLLDLVGLGIREVVKQLWVIRPKQLKPLLGLIAFWVLSVAVLLTVGWHEVLVIYLVSIYPSFWAVFRIRSWTEHIGIQGTHRFDPGVFVRYFLFPYNTWCHYEHHKWPTISYQHLPAARECDTAVEILSTKQLFDFFSGKSYERR